MKICGPHVQSLIKAGSLRFHSASVAAFAAGVLGIAHSPAQSREHVEAIELWADCGQVASAPSLVGFTRNFADSRFSGISNGAARIELRGLCGQWTSQQIPAALGLAFSQQWARLGGACVHAALLCVENAGVLALGARASGKSTLSASAFSAGGVVVSDDYLLLGRRDGGHLGERVRRFLSLRRSWAGDKLLLKQAVDDWHDGRTGNRAYFEIPENDPRFPPFARIDRVWLLSRPRAGRREESLAAPVSQAEVYAAIVAGIQPLLLGADFPFERDQLQPLFLSLIANVPAARVETGLDIVKSPREAWRRLLDATA